VTVSLQIAALVLILVTAALILRLSKKVSQADAPVLASRLETFEKTQERTERTVKEEIAKSRDEFAKSARDQRKELTDAFQTLGESTTQHMKDQLMAFSGRLGEFAKDSSDRLDAARIQSGATAKDLREEVVKTLNVLSEMLVARLKESSSAEKAQLETFSGQIESLTKTIDERLAGIRSEFSENAKQLRGEVVAALKGITESTMKTMGELAQVQERQLETMSTSIAKLSDSNEKKLEAVRATVEHKLQSMQTDNAKQLDQMRQTVDEKLQGTLDKRLGESFKQVSDRLELVHKGLGEMQTLATGVGDLKKVLTNVKTRGTWGETQLGALLEQVLNPDQFATNVATKDGGERVEFAVSLPGQGSNNDETVWLPIDAKFPIEDYHRLIDAQERGDADGVEAAGRQLENRLKNCAKDISTKYLSPPKTTDFGILFLPIEGLFAEAIRRPDLADTIQRKWRVVIAGPTTLWALLNSLQMGFRTLAIQKRSSEVWNLLAGVKTEWGKYGEALDVVRKKLQEASNKIDKVQVRSRAVGKKLKDVQELPSGTDSKPTFENALDEETIAETDMAK
jgi:DNA recombination protein RmuC